MIIINDLLLLWYPFIETDIVGKSGTRIFELKRNDLGQPRRTVDTEVGLPSVEVKCGDQPHQTIVMISMKVGNENVVDAREPDLIFFDQQLGAFSTVDKEIFILNPQKLRSMMSVMSEGSRIGS